MPLTPVLIIISVVMPPSCVGRVPEMAVCPTSMKVQFAHTVLGSVPVTLAESTSKCVSAEYALGIVPPMCGELCRSMKVSIPSVSGMVPLSSGILLACMDSGDVVDILFGRVPLMCWQSSST